MTEQAKHVAIPRRFGMVMQEIWTLQPRFEARVRKRVFRLLAHPRFRAAYDFLLLRAVEGPDIAELGEWWTRAQTLSHEELSAELSATATPAKSEAASSPAEASQPAPAATKKKRPRRRRSPTAAPDAD